MHLRDTILPQDLTPHQRKHCIAAIAHVYQWYTIERRIGTSQAPCSPDRSGLLGVEPLNTIVNANVEANVPCFNNMVLSISLKHLEYSERCATGQKYPWRMMMVGTKLMTRMSAPANET